MKQTATLREAEIRCGIWEFNQTMANEEFVTSAIRVRQPIGTFFVAAIPAGILLDITVPDTLRLALDLKYKETNPEEWSSAVHMLGNQRPLEDRRLREIGDYVDTVEATFPNSIILSANSPIHSPLAVGGADWTVREALDGRLELHVPKDARQASVVDGQHRLYSFLRSKIEDRASFQLICAVFFEMPHSMQAMVFATINTNQKAVRRSLALNLHGYNVEDEPRERWSPEKLAVFVARRLNWDSESALYQHIKIEAEGAPTATFLPGATRTVPMAAMVDGFLRLITRDHKRDRTLLRTERLFSRPKRADLPADAAPLRGWYTTCSDLQLYSVVRHFVQMLYDNVWGAAGEGSMLTRAVGIRGLFYFLADILPRVDQSNSPPRVQDMGAFLGSLTLKAQPCLSLTSQVDFSDPFFEATGRGQRRIENTLGLVAELITLDEVPPAERDDYERLISTVFP